LHGHDLFMKYSLIIVTHQRLTLLKECLASIESQRPSSLEIIVILNGEDPATDEYMKNQSGYHFVKIERSTPAQARNQALHFATGEWIGFLDDDIKLSERYFKNLESLLNESNFDVLGGPDATFPDAGPWEKAIGLALTSPLSTSKTRYRHDKNLTMSQHVDESSLILCNLWIKKSKLPKNPFPKDFWRNEENVMLHELSLKNLIMTWSPNLYVFHKRKDNFKALYRAVSSSGENRLRSFALHPDSLDIRFFVPAFFVLYLLMLPILILIIPKLVFLIAAYAIINLSTSIYFGKALWLRVAVIQLVINTSYGIGMWRGLIRPQAQ